MSYQIPGTIFQDQFVVEPPLTLGAIPFIVVVFVPREPDLLMRCRATFGGVGQKENATVDKTAVSFATGKGAVRPSKVPPHRCFEACLFGGGFASAAEGGPSRQHQLRDPFPYYGLPERTFSLAVLSLLVSQKKYIYIYIFFRLNGMRA